MKISVSLGPNFLGVFLVTYLPTMLMNVINQVSRHSQTVSSCE